MSGLGRLIPPDFSHIERHPSRVRKATGKVETTLRLSDSLRKFYNQGDTPQCVAYSQCIAASLILQSKERFDAPEMYRAVRTLEGKDAPPEGAYIRDGYQVMMDRGPRETRPKAGLDPKDGWGEFQWCLDAAQVRDALAAGRVCILGLDWLISYDQPVKIGGEWWIGRSDEGGPARGGHAICITRWSDRRQAVQLTNSWGMGFPRVWMPASVVDAIIKGNGEAGFGVPRTG